METKRFAKDAFIFRQCEIPRCMYDIVSGRVGIYAEHGEGMRTKLAEFGPGQVFGEMELIASSPRCASAVALEDVELVEIDQAAFSGYFQDKPEKVLDIMRQVSQRVRSTTQHYVDACHTVHLAVEADASGRAPNDNVRQKLTLLERIGLAMGK